MRPPEATREAIEVHQAAGRRFQAGGVRSFVREQGGGTPVVLVHGVPTSSFLYRKVIPAVADQGLRAIAFDFPGLGLSERPDSFDYSWSGLARWTGEAIDALGIDRCHLVVHDIGGPIGCEWAVRNPDRVHSLTALNTLARRRHASTGRGRCAVRDLRGSVRSGCRHFVPSSSSELFYRQGIANRAAIPRREIYAHYYLLKRGDGGRAFLQIMRGFELTAEKQRFLWDGLAQRPYPARMVWGERDPALGLDQLELVQEALGWRTRSSCRPSTSSRRTRRPRSPRRSPTSPPRSASPGPGAAPAAPFSTSRGSPRSGNGISTTSKSRGAIVRREGLARLGEHVARRRSASETCTRASSFTLRLPRRARAAWRAVEWPVSAARSAPRRRSSRRARAAGPRARRPGSSRTARCRR